MSGDALQPDLPSPRDALNALARLTIAPITPPAPHGQAFARASIFFPIVGLLIGLSNVGVYHVAAALLAPEGTRLCAIAAWTVVAAEWRDVPKPWFAAQLLLKWLALSQIAASPGGALLFAPLLGSWSLVVVATGTRNAADPQRKFNARINFQEFAIASVATAGIMFTLGEAFGILVFAGAAAVVLVVRLLAHRLGSGVSWRLLRMNAQAIELLVCAFFAAFT